MGVLSLSSNMKFVVVLACLVVVALGQGEEGVQCNATISQMCPVLDGSQPTYFADPEDCCSYCECASGTAWKFSCAPLHFDEDLNVCNWSYNMDCGSRPILC